MRYGYEYDKIVSNMRSQINIIASDIIIKHMRGAKFHKKYFDKDNRYTIELYNDKKEKLLNNIIEDIDFTQQVYIKNNKIYIINKGTYGHLGIDYIVLRDTINIKNDLLNITISIFFTIFVIMNIIGYFLSRLFLKPILRQREQLDLFIKDTTHELNTPITALLMSINNKNVTSSNNIKRINLIAKRISEIYSDLTYIFLQNNTKAIDIIESIDIKSILLDELQYFKELALRKKLKLSYDLEDFEYKIDKQDFTRLINNIISNSIKYTNRNGEIKVILKNKQLEIIDNGIGIEEAKQKDIFKRFYRATSNSGGFGVGLDIVSSICKKYDIQINLKSTKGSGTIFILIF